MMIDAPPLAVSKVPAAVAAMKIVLISHSRNDPDAGASRVYHQLQDGLRARGHFVKTQHYEDLCLPQQPLLARTIEKIAMPQWVGWKQRPQDFDGTDVVTAPSGMGYCLFKRLKGISRRPLLVNHQHGLSVFDHQARLTEALAGHVAFPLHKRVAEWPPLLWDKRGARHADVTVLQNLRDLDHLHRRGEFGQTLTMIAPALHPEILAASKTVTAPEARDGRSLLWFGSFVARKGAAVLPDAFERVLDAVPEATLRIGGTGLAADDIMSRFSPRARHRIEVLPRLSLQDQITEYQNAAIFLFPSVSEGFGLALIEAMALGLMAVTTLTGFGADFIRQGESGLIVAQSSAIHLAQGIVEAIRGDAARVSISRCGQALAQTFTLDRMAAAYEAVFVEGLARLRLAEAL